MNMSLGKKWSKQLKGRIQQYEFQVGVLESKEYKLPKERKGPFDESNIGSFAKGPVRRVSSVPSGQKVGDVLVENMKRLNIDLLRAPFKKKSSELMQFTLSFLSLVTYKPGMTIRRVENLLQAVVRNPIFKQEYGINSEATAETKGFNRHLFDTGQMFKNIRVRARRRV